MIWIVAALAALIILGLLTTRIPLKKRDLIEGVFSGKESGWIMSGFVEKKGIGYLFRGFCRSCIEKKNFSWYGMCRQSFPVKTKNTSSFEPQEGDSIKIVGTYNLFGGLLAYEILRTDFETTYPNYDELPKRACEHTLHKEQDAQKTGIDFLGAAERRAKRQGRTVEQVLEDLHAKPHYPTKMCLYPHEVETGVTNFLMLPYDRQNHVRGCDFCRSLINYIKPKPPKE